MAGHVRNGEQREFARKMRKEPTEPERKLWLALRARQLGCKFRRQVAIGAYVVDFVCLSHKLVIELDGVQHAEDESSEHDARRTTWLESRGFRVLRFWNHQLDEGVKLVIDEIRTALEKAKPTAAPSPRPSPPRRGEGAGGIS
jgi:very-short-patch-repair endonuclease